MRVLTIVALTVLCLTSNAATPALHPGPGWSGDTEQPAQIGSGFAADTKPIARWNVVPYDIAVCHCEIGVVAFHINGINRVEFSADGGDWVSVTEPKLNPRTNTVEYFVDLQCGTISDGPIEVRAVVYPNTGVPRVLGGDYDLTREYQGTHWTGEHSLTVISNTRGSLPAQVVSLPAGNYTWGQSPLYFGTQSDKTRWLIYRPANGVKREQVVITGATASYPTQRDFRKIKLENVTVRGSGATLKWYTYSDSMLWCDKVRWIGKGQFDADGTAVGAAHQWWTDCWISDQRIGQATQFIRNCKFERVGEDVIRAGYMLVNLDISSIDSGATDWHSGVIANPLLHDNRIYYGVTMTNIIDSLMWPMRNGTDVYWQNYDVAIVNCNSELTENSPRTQTWYCGADTKNMFIKDSRFKGGSFAWRTGSTVPEHWKFTAQNVVLDTVNINDEGGTPTPHPTTGVTIR